MMSDKELIEAYALKNDERAFRQLVERYYPMVKGVCQRRLNDSDVEDVCQATFLVLSKKARFIKKHEALPCWLHTIARRLSQQALHRQLREQDSREEFASQWKIMHETSNQQHWDEIKGHLDDAINRLPKKFKEVTVACYLNQQSYEEAAAQLDITPDAVRNRLGRARIKMRKYFESKRIVIPASALSGAALQNASAQVSASEIEALTQSILNSKLTTTSTAILANKLISTLFMKKIITIASVTILAASAGYFLLPDSEYPEDEIKSEKRVAALAAEPDEPLVVNYDEPIDRLPEESFLAVTSEPEPITQPNYVFKAFDFWTKVTQASQAKDIYEQQEILQGLGILLTLEELELLRAEKGMKMSLKSPINKFLEAWAEARPEEAIDWAKSVVLEGGAITDQGLDNKLKAVMSIWLKKEPEKALNYAQSQLSAELSNAVSQMYANAQLARRDPYRRGTQILEMATSIDKRDALYELVDNWPEGQQALAMEWGETSIKSKRFRDEFIYRMAWEWADTDPKELLNWLDLNEKGTDFNGMRTDAALGLLTVDTDRALDTIERFSGSHRQVAFDKIAREWATIDPDSAVEWANSLAPSDFDSAMPAVISELNPQDRAQTINNMLEGGIDPPIEGALLKVARYAASFDPNEGTQILDSIMRGQDLKTVPATEVYMDTIQSISRNIMAINGPEAALAWNGQLAFDSENEKEQASQGILLYWLTNDFERARNWINQSDGFSPDFKTKVINRIENNGIGPG